MDKLSFSTGAVLSQAWQVFKQRWGQLLGVGVLYMVLSSIIASLPALFQGSDSQVAVLGASLLTQLMSLFLSIGMTKIVLSVVRLQEVSIADMFEGGKYLLQYFLGSLVVGIITFIGFLLLVVPGIIWSLKYMFVLYLIVDEELDFSNAMKESERMTSGIKGQLFIFGLAMVGVNLLGMIPLFLGLLITIPVTSLASFVLYDVLRKQCKQNQSGVTTVETALPVEPTTPTEVQQGV